MKINQLILAALLAASLALTARAQTPPAQAAAAGFNTAVLNDTFTSSADYSSTQGTATVAGAQWYPYFWAKASSVSIANNVMTVTGGNIATVPTYAVGTGTAQSVPGSFFHGYFEASFKFSPTGTSSTSEGVWPGFWLFGMDAQSTQASSFNCPECDIFEAYPLGGTSFDPVQTLHNWLYPGNNGGDSETANTDNLNDMSSLVGSSESTNPNDGAYHTYGCLWKSTGNGTGSVQFYYDNFLVNHDGTTSFPVGAGTGFPGQEQNAMSVILQGSANQPIMVQYVRVWQAGTGSSGSSGTTLTAQTISGFGSALSLSTTASPYALPSTTSAGLTPTYTITSGPATVSGTSLTLTGAGTVIVSATQAGNSTYAAYSGSETITVTAPTTTQTVSGFPSALSLSTTASPYSLPSTTSVGLSITYSVTSGPATVSGHSLTLNGAGTVVVKATQAGNTTYAPYSGTETITVTSPGTQTLANFPSTLDLTLAQTPYTLPSATTAGLTVTYTVVSGPGTVSGNTLTLTGAGTLVLNARQAGNSSYAAYSGSETITVTTVAQTVAALPSAMSLTMAQSPYTLPAKTDQGLPISYSLNTSTGSVSGNILSMYSTSPISLTASQAGNATYAPWSESVAITVTNTTKTAQTLASLPTSLSLTMAQSPYTLPNKTDQGLIVSYSIVSGPGSVSGNTLTLTGAGTVVVSATQAGNATYSSFQQSTNITVTSTTKTAQTVSNFPSTLSLDMAQTPYGLPSTTSAGLTLSYTVVSGPATISGSTLTLTGAGTVVLSATQSGNSTYAAYSGAEAITVTTVAQTVSSFPSSMNLTTGASPYTLPANTDQGLGISYSVVSGPGSISGHTLTLTGAGTVVVSATQAGNATYAAYTGNETITVSALSAQTVSSFPSTQNVTLGSGAISLTAKTSAGQTITYTVVSGPATISGDTLTITGSGTVVISASAAGNSTSAAYSGTETITVTSGSTMTFTQWEALYFNSTQLANSAIAGATATPQNDGVPNLLKYVYDINPSQAMSTNDYNAMPATDVDTTTSPGTTYLTLTYRQYAKVTGVTIQVQTSPDLQTWTTVSPSITKQTGTDPNTGDPIMEDEVNTNGSASEFIRLNVTSP